MQRYGLLTRVGSVIKNETIPSLFTRRSSESFATHLPILIGLSELYSPNALLELGSGMFSTPAFLNRSCFPTLRRVTTIEDDRNWYEDVKAKVGTASQFEIHHVNSIVEWIDETNLHAYDFIFVDDSKSRDKRANSIAAVFRKAAPNAIVIIHDFECRRYRRAVPPGWRQVTFSTWKPFTGVAWRQEDRKPDLARLQSLIRSHRQTSPVDAANWSEIFRDGLDQRVRRHRSSGIDIESIASGVRSDRMNS
jgi:predicted O-methyltransferase YrrM